MTRRDQLVCLSIALVPVLLSWAFSLVESTSAELFDVELRADKYRVRFDAMSLLGVVTSFLLALTAFGTTRGRLFVLSPLVVFALLYLLMVFPGIILTAAVNNPAPAYTIAGTWSLMLGIWYWRFLRSLIGRGQKYAFRWRNRTVVNTSSAGLFLDGKLTLGLTWAAGLGVVSLGLFLATGGLGRLAAFSSLGELAGGNFLELTQTAVREERETRYVGLTLVRVLQDYVILLLLPLAALSLLDLGWQRSSKTLAVVGALVLFAAMVFAFGSGQRLMFAQIALLAAIWWSIRVGFSVRFLLPIGLLVATALAGSTIVQGRMSDMGSPLANATGSANRLIERVFLTKGQVTTWVYDYIPAVEQFQKGATVLQKLGGVASGEPSLAQKIHRHVEGGEGTSGPNFIGDLYANWGFPGILLGSFLLGCVLLLIDDWWRDSVSRDAVVNGALCYVALAVGYWGYSDLAAPKTLGGHVLIVYLLTYVLLRSMRTVAGPRSAGQAPATEGIR